MNMKKFFFSTFLVFLVASMGALAATDGSLDSTSTGTSDVSLVVNDNVLITGLNDVNFPAYGATNTGDINQGDAFCVYRNGGDGYSITPSNPNGVEFEITSVATGDSIQYTLALDESDDASSAAESTYDSAQSFTSGSVFVNCSDEGDGTNTAFDIRINEQELRDTTTGTYTGTLQLLLQPI